MRGGVHLRDEKEGKGLEVNDNLQRETKRPSNMGKIHLRLFQKKLEITGEGAGC